MTRLSKVQYFEEEGRKNLPLVMKSVKAFLRDREIQNLPLPRKMVLLTREGEGAILAYNNGLHTDDMKVVAVTFPLHFTGKIDGQVYTPEVPERVRKFLTGVGIPIITNRLPFDPISGAESHNHDMGLLNDALAIFGGSVPLVIQAILQATDAGQVEAGELVIGATGDTALLATASTTRLFLKRDESGLSVSEIICKPRSFGITKKRIQAPTPDSSTPAKQIEGEVISSPHNSDK